MIDGALNVALALQGPLVEVRWDRSDRGSTEVLLVEIVRHEEVVLSALFDEPLCLVHGVVWLEKAGGEVARRHSHHVLDPSPVWPIVHELDVELLGDPEMTWLLVSRVFKDSATTALACGAGWQRENGLVNRKVWNQKVGNRSCYPLVASFCHCVLLDWPVGDVLVAEARAPPEDRGFAKVRPPVVVKTSAQLVSRAKNTWCALPRLV